MTARCSTCGINYPSHMKCCLVDGCRRELDYMSGDEQDPDWRASVDRANTEAEHRRSSDDKVEAWRLEQLLKAGCPLENAETLAARPWHEVDLHQAVDLLAAVQRADRDVELAVRILL